MVVVGDPVTDADGRIVATRGFYIDITESFNADLQQSITDRLQVIVSHREIIDQAKGMLMLIYRLSADAAFAVLMWRSQELNIKLSTLAEKLVAELPNLLNAHPAMRAPIDHYLLTLTPQDRRRLSGRRPDLKRQQGDIHVNGAVVRDGTPVLTRGPSRGPVKQPDEYKIHTTPVPVEAHGVDWLGLFNFPAAVPWRYWSHGGAPLWSVGWLRHSFPSPLPRDWSNP